jgi:hypothetical protein
LETFMVSTNRVTSSFNQDSWKDIKYTPEKQLGSSEEKPMYLFNRWR